MRRVHWNSCVKISHVSIGSVILQGLGMSLDMHEDILYSNIFRNNSRHI
jgi:hypothetical protein